MVVQHERFKRWKKISNMKKIGLYGMWLTVPITAIAGYVWASKSKEGSVQTDDAKHLTLFVGGLAALSTIVYLTTKN